MVCQPAQVYFPNYFFPERLHLILQLNFFRMILSDRQILHEIEIGNIKLEPFRPECLGTNSYDVHLGKYIGTYKDEVLDARKHNQIEVVEIPEEGFVLMPEKLYLGATFEYTETHAHVPFLEGKSSVGRLGKGDVGFCNHWTLEISVKQPVRVYFGMPIGQLIYFRVDGGIENFYNKKAGAKYNQVTDKPVESMMWRNKW
jgi:dCTP deaminase